MHVWSSSDRFGFMYSGNSIFDPLCLSVVFPGLLWRQSHNRLMMAFHSYLTFWLCCAHIRHHTPSDPLVGRFWKFLNAIWGLLASAFSVLSPICLEFTSCQSVESPHFVWVQSCSWDFPVLTSISTNLRGPYLHVWLMFMYVCKPTDVREWCVLAQWVFVLRKDLRDIRAIHYYYFYHHDIPVRSGVTAESKTSHHLYDTQRKAAVHALYHISLVTYEVVFFCFSEAGFFLSLIFLSIFFQKCYKPSLVCFYVGHVRHHCLSLTTLTYPKVHGRPPQQEEQSSQWVHWSDLWGTTQKRKSGLRKS